MLSYWNKHINPKIPEMDLEKFAGSENWFTYANFYDDVVKEHDFRTFVEVGCWKGHSISHLVKKLQERGTHFTVFAVDLWDRLPKDNELWDKFPDQLPIIYSIYNYVLSKTGTRKDVFDYRASSISAASDFSNGSVDFCFIDASHNKEAVLADLKAWFPKVRKGGIIAGHDASSEGVASAIRTFDFGNQVFEHKEEDVWAVWKKD